MPDIGTKVTRKVPADFLGVMAVKAILSIFCYSVLRPALSEARSKIVTLFSSFLVSRPELFPIVRFYTVEQDHLLT